MGTAGPRVTLREDDVWAALQEVTDPEIPVVSLVDLGIIHRVAVAPDGAVTVEVLPTFAGCPALELIRRAIADRVVALPGATRADVRFVLDPVWTTDRITPRGRERLASFGIAPPHRAAAGPPGPGLRVLGPGDAPAPAEPQVIPLGELLEDAGVPCPYCGSTATTLESPFGPTLCRATCYCHACKNPFEQMKVV